MPALIVCSVVVVTLSAALAALGHASVSGELRETWRIASALVGRALADAVRIARSEATVTINLNSPQVMQNSSAPLLVLINSDAFEESPKSLVIRPSRGEATIKEVEIQLTRAARATIAIAVYDLQTLTPLSAFTTTVPRYPLLSRFREYLVRLTQQSGRVVTRAMEKLRGEGGKWRR
jgi:hypothetical protein